MSAHRTSAIFYTLAHACINAPVSRACIIGAILLCWSGAILGEVGPFKIANSDSSSTLSLQLATQFQTYWESKDKGVGKEREEALFARARRIRPTLTVLVPEYRTAFRLHLSTAPGSLELMDLYFNTEFRSQSQLRLGQYKVPFTRYRIQSFQKLTFVDWSIVSKYYGAERQMGLSLHNGFEKPPRFGYVVGVFSGINARASHGIGLPALFGEEVANPSDLSGSTSRIEFHPELALHLSYNSGAIDLSSDSDEKGGAVRYSLASSVMWDTRPTMYQDFVVRFAQELLFKYKHFSLMGAGYLGWMDLRGGSRTHVAMSGLLVQSSFRMSERYECAMRYALVDMDDVVGKIAYERARNIVDNTDDENAIVQYRDAGVLTAEHEGTFCLNIYLEGHGLKLQNEFGFIGHQRRDGNRTDYQARSQVQISF